MEKILINNELTSYNLPVYFEDNISVNYVMINPNHNIEDHDEIVALDMLLSRIDSNFSSTKSVEYITNTKIISTYDDVIEHFKPSENKYFVTGTTVSKFNAIDTYFSKDRAYTLNLKKNAPSGVIKSPIKDMINLRNGVKIKLPSLDISAMILNENNKGYREYVLYLDTENPIKYIDYNNSLTTFTYLRAHDTQESVANLVYFDNIIEEPKISLELFIDRGAISVFDNLKHLKTVKTLNDLNKVGLNYFKINKKGYNFNNL